MQIAVQIFSLMNWCLSRFCWLRDSQHISASSIAPSNPAHPKWHDPLNRVLNVKSFNIYIFQIFHQSHFWCPSVCSQVVAQMMDIMIVPCLWNMMMVDVSGRLIFWSLKIHQTFSGMQNFYVWNNVIQNTSKWVESPRNKHFHHEINENLTEFTFQREPYPGGHGPSLTVAGIQ